MMIIAHRGASGTAPENTLAAFEQALQMGADWIELDVHASRDGEIVVFHDDTLRRTTNGRGPLRDFSLAELKRLDAGSFFHPRFAAQRIPSLREVIARVKPEKVGLCIEMKRGRHLGAGFEEKLVDLLKREGMIERCCLMSFDHAAVRRAKEREPGVRVLLEIDRRMRPGVLLDRIRRHRGDGVFLPALLATPGVVQSLHDQGLTIVVWTVNSIAQMERFLLRHVDGICTNYPERLVKLLR